MSKSTEEGWGETQPAATATTEATGGWDAAPTNGDTAATGEWANDAGQDSLSSLKTEEPKPASTAAPPSKKAGGWAGLFSKPDPPKPAASSIPAAQPDSVPSATVTAPAQEESQPLPPPIEPQVVEDGPSELPSAPHSEAPDDITPSKDALTEDNLEQLPDESNPPMSQTAASTAASTIDPRGQTLSAKPAIRPTSGYAATALKATGGGRSASFNRKVMEQQEAVVMPSNHAVEKAAVQFGKMGMSGDSDDVDEDREEPETRTQLPDDSPVAPRASLPPGMSASQTAASPAQAESQPPTEPQAQRHAPGLPPAPQAPSHMTQQAPSSVNDPYRYGQGQKPYDPFGQSSAQTQAQPTTQEPFSNQMPGQTVPASVQQQYEQYYGRDAAAAYQAYYSQYGHGQGGQRAGSAFGSSAQDMPSQYASARPQEGYGQQDAQNSGQNTPAPGMPAHPAQHSQQMGAQGQAGYPYGYPGAYGQQYPQYGHNYMNQMSHRYGANRPAFDDARRSDDHSSSQQHPQQQQQQQQQQYGYNYNQQYGGSYKSGMYGQPGQQPYSYEHSSSPANVASFGGREAMYGRSGSAQPPDAQQAGASAHAYPGMQDPYARSSSGFGQGQSMSQQHSGQHGEDVSKPAGPSPSVQAGRPGSTTNSQSQQSGLVPPQSQHSGQQAFGGYPQYGGFGGNFGGQQNAQSTGYGGYGSNAFGSYGGAYGGRGGWNH